MPAPPALYSRPSSPRASPKPSSSRPVKNYLLQAPSVAPPVATHTFAHDQALLESLRLTAANLRASASVRQAARRSGSAGRSMSPRANSTGLLRPRGSPPLVLPGGPQAGGKWVFVPDGTAPAGPPPSLPPPLPPVIAPVPIMPQRARTEYDDYSEGSRTSYFPQFLKGGLPTNKTVTYF